MNPLSRRLLHLFVDNNLLAASALGTVVFVACARRLFMSAEAAGWLLVLGLVIALYASMRQAFTTL
jgi:hypothetical protein